jgi:hypothetical protein
MKTFRKEVTLKRFDIRSDYLVRLDAYIDMKTNYL